MGLKVTSPLDSQLHVQPKSPWDLITSYLQFRSKDAQFWWDTTGRMFSKLLQGAGYSIAEQYRELFFYAVWVVPELGLAPDLNGKPRGWPSVWAPGGTPIEFSWDFGVVGDGAMVRYSWELIGKHAGTSLDPLNGLAADDWIDRVQKQGLVPGLHLDWYRHFTRQMLPPPDMKRVKTADSIIEETTPKAGTGVALDIEPSGPVMKVLLYPGLRALELGISNLDMVERAIRALPTDEFSALQVEPLLEYLREATARWGMETGIVCIDCLKPGDARIKIYVRAPHTTLDWLMDAITLGGRMDLSAYEDSVQDLKDLWQAFLGDGPDVVPADAPGRANPGFYFTVGRGKPASPKMYLSPGYFVKNDQDVIDRLRNFFATRRSGNAKTDVVDNYERALKSTYGGLLEKPGCGTLFYVGAAMTRKDGLRVVTYHDPQIIGAKRQDLWRMASTDGEDRIEKRASDGEESDGNKKARKSDC
ncbi:aromatic prenyltransferase [Podospora didyma]|uniref:Aromatic prenyltransferase n=1 Tax=Podospora didyma TaxID=330526 RepID=A0AAE0K174_9PEZI|nr:aromatic prenyltransferase [Podospora didyma]